MKRREYDRTHQGTEKRRISMERHNTSEKGRKTKREANARANPRRIIVGRIYLGTVGFTDSELAAMKEAHGPSQ